MVSDTTSCTDRAIPILYLLTDEISSVLVRGQLGYLQEHGFDVTVAARRADPDQPPQPGTWDGGVTVEHLPFVRQPSPIADLQALWTTVRLIRRVRPAIVNASTPKAGLLGTIAAWLCRVPVRVYVVRGLRFETMTGWTRRVFVALEWLTCRLATAVVFNSRSLMRVGEGARVIRPGRGEVVGAGSGNGIDVDRFADDELPSQEEARERFGLPLEAPVIGFVGRFTKDKGIDDLVWAFERLSPPPGPLRSREQFHGQGGEMFTRTAEEAGGEAPWLLLVGQFEDGDPVDPATRAAVESHERIVVVPWLDDTRPAHRAMDVLAFPSAREGLPNVPLEAQLCGVPVIGYAATGTVDAVAPAGVTTANSLVEPGDRDGLLDALAEVLSHGGADPTAGRAWVSERFDRGRLWHDLSSWYCDLSA